MRRTWAALAGAAAVVVGTLVPVAAQAALPDPAPGDITALASLTKDVSPSTGAPGDTFTYTLTLGCSSITDVGCRAAVLTDTVPAPLELVGAVIGGGTNTGDVAIAGNTVTVTWTTALGDGTTGILDSTTGIVQITARLPENASHDFDGAQVRNDAQLEGANFADVSDQVAITPQIPLNLATEATKSFDPSTVAAREGAPVSAGLSGTNTSNATVESLAIQDPAGNPPGSPDPFQYLEFAGFGTVSAPAGATDTIYQVWVDTPAPGDWVDVPGGDFAASGIDPATVHGARVTFTGAIPAGATGGVDLDLTVNAAGEAAGDIDVPNTVQSEVVLGDQSQTAPGDATLTLVQNEIQVGASKSFDPQVVLAGESSTVALGAVNDSPFPLDRLTIQEPSAGAFGDADHPYTFSGFSAPIGYPCGTGVTGSVVLQPGGQIIPFADGAAPQLPDGLDPATVASFAVVFAGAIDPGCETTVQFGVVVEEDLDPAALPLTATNEALVIGESGDDSGRATAEDDLYIYDEVVHAETDKTIRPGQILGSPGEVVTVTIDGGLTERPTGAPDPDDPNNPNNTASTGSTSQVVIQDPPDAALGGDHWWNAFDLTGIAQTPVPACATLTIQYYDTKGTIGAADDTWETLASDPSPIPGPTIYSAAVPAAVSQAAGGIRFIYDYAPGAGCTADGFAPGTDFSPSYTSSLREQGRYNPDPSWSLPLDPNGDPSMLSNCAVTDAADALDPLPVACDQLVVQPIPPGGPDMIDKEYGTSSSGGIKSVIARSGDTIPSTLYWGTGGYSNLATVRIADVTPATAPIEQSVYDAFNLVSISAITPATDPLIAYDMVTAVELWNGSTWVPAANSPCTPTGGCIGQLPQIGLTAAEQASTLSVRLTLAESPNREAASQGNLGAPPVGSGVARSFGLDRQVAVVWQVRDTRRSDGAPILGDVEYNLAGQDGVVRNTAGIEGFPADGGPTLSQQDSDDVIIIDVPLTVTTTKTWTGGPLAIPTGGIATYPLSTITVTTRNTTPARVDQLSIADPAPGSAQTDAFDAAYLERISAITVPAGATSTLVTLTCIDGTVRTGDRDWALGFTNINQQLCDAAGVVVAFAGRIDANAAGQIQLSVRLRPEWRSTGEPVTPADSPLFNEAQGVISDVEPPRACPPPADARYACANDSANIALEAPTYGVDASKTIAPSSQKEDDRSNVTVTLGGQPTGSARTYSLTLEDDDPTFWNAFDFATASNFGGFTAPTGRVQSCYLSGAAFTADAVANETVSGATTLGPGGTTNITTGAAGFAGGTWTCQSLPIVLGPITTDQGSVQQATKFLHDARDAGVSIQGLRFTFWQRDLQGWTNPSTPRITAPFQVVRRDCLRSSAPGACDPVPTTSADELAAPGEEAAGIFRDTSTAYGESVSIGQGPLTAADSADAEYRYLHNTVALNVVKSPAGDVQPGVVIPFTLSFSNTGEEELTDPVFSDRLPVAGTPPVRQLICDPDRDPSVLPWSATLTGDDPDPSSPNLPTDPGLIDVTTDAGSADPCADAATQIVWRMPAGSVLEPGQTYTIAIGLMIRPGVAAGQDLTNLAVMDIGDTPIDPGGCVTTFVQDPDAVAGIGLCMDDAVIRPLASPALSTVKYVKADEPLGGGSFVNTANNFPFCTATNADPVGLDFRAPCVPITNPGDTETWRLRVTNAGTVPLDTLVAIDNLPTPGDQGLVVLLPRGSEWEPTFADTIALRTADLTGAVPGATLSTYYSTASVPCTTDLNPLADPQCAPGAWAPLDGSVDLAAVHSLKFVVTFDAGDLLDPSETINITFRTRTTPADPTDARFPIAWNTVSTGGAAVGATGRIVVPATEGRRVGVAYPTGSLDLRKEVTGPNADAAPASFPVTLVCVYADDDDPAASFTVRTDVVLIAGQTLRVDGLPVGALCTVEEGQFGQTGTTYSPADGAVVAASDGTAEISLLTITNNYGVASLTLRKASASSARDENGDQIPYGPFPFRIVCTSGAGVEYDQTLTIGPDNTWAVPQLPTGTQCVITELDDLGASGTDWRVNAPQIIFDSATGFADGTGRVSLAGASLTVALPGDAATPFAVLATNRFGSGPLDLAKVVDGEAAADFGAGPFVFVIDCTLDTGAGPISVWQDQVTLGGGEPLERRIDNIALGASCRVTEIVAGGATHWDLQPAPDPDDTPGVPDALVVIGDGDGSAETPAVDGQAVTVTATNTFAAGRLTVAKVRDGDGADLWGAGPFEVTLACTDDTGTAVAIPGGATRVLSADNNYTASYTPLLVGLSCVLDETDAGGADGATIVDGDGEPAGIITIAEDGELRLVVTNTFDVGAITVIKTVSGDLAADHATAGFGVQLACRWQGGDITIPGGAQRTVSVADSAQYADLPIGALCTLTEPDSGGASAISFSPADPADPSRALVTVAEGAAASITIDNRFDAPPPTPPTGGEGDAGKLGSTGSDLRTPMLIGLALLTAGAGVLTIGAAHRRRRAG